MAIKINTLSGTNVDQVFDIPTDSGNQTFSIVVGAGSPEDTVDCLQTALDLATPLGNIDFLVIDRCENRETSQVLQQLSGDLAVVTVPDMQWAKAWETALSSARQDFVLLITADVRLTPDCLETLRNRLSVSAKLTAVSPAISRNNKDKPSNAPQTGEGVCLLVSTQRLQAGSFNVGYEPSARATCEERPVQASATPNAPIQQQAPQVPASAEMSGSATPWLPHSPVITEQRKQAVANGQYGPVDCPMCGQTVTVVNVRPDVRESGDCPSCGAWTRMRQLALVICSAFERSLGRPINSIAELAEIKDLTVYNMQSTGALHNILSQLPGYQCSEYFDGGMASGTYVNGVMHQDVMNLSFADNMFDLVISSDVFEHVANPYVGFAEILRVLKPGGRHVFTVPFWDHQLLDVTRASVVNGNVVHHMEPCYHQDPVRNGALVFTDFGLEMLVQHGKLGYEKVDVYHCEDVKRGVFDVQPVFDAVKGQ